MAKSFVIDGEIAALDAEGRSSFQLLQSYGIRKNIPLVYYAFDLLSLEGTDVRGQPLLGRRKLLAKLLEGAPANIRFSEELQGTRAALLEIAYKFGLEGLIAKRPDSGYEPGRKVKAIASRLARFDHDAIARTKSFVDQITLPDNSELGPAWNDFIELFQRPATLAQAARLVELGLNTDCEFERSLGGRLVESLPD